MHHSVSNAVGTRPCSARRDRNTALAGPSRAGRRNRCTKDDDDAPLLLLLSPSGLGFLAGDVEEGMGSGGRQRGRSLWWAHFEKKKGGLKIFNSLLPHGGGAKGEVVVVVVRSGLLAKKS